MYKNKAYILIITVIILGLILLFSIFLVSHYIKEKNIAQIGVNQLIAEQAAISGIEQSLYQVQSAPAWTTGYANSTLTKSNATYNVTFNSASGQPYSTNNYNGASSVTGYNSRIIPAGAIHIVSKGTFSGSSTV